VLYKVHRIIPVSNIKTGLTIEGFAALVLIILHFTDYALRPPPIQHYLLKLWTNFDILVGLLGLGIGPLQGFCLQTKEQHRKTRAQVHASSGIRTNDLSGWTVQNYINLKKAASKTCTITTTTTTTTTTTIIIIKFHGSGPMPCSVSELLLNAASFKQPVGFLEWGIGPSQSLYLHRTTSQ
jgi:hypothetical protein